jgi:hypothetical protein
MMQYQRAYEMVSELQEMNFKPTTAMYNAIMAGYFREVSLLVFYMPMFSLRFSISQTR